MLERKAENRKQKKLIISGAGETGAARIIMDGFSGDVETKTTLVMLVR